MITAKNIMAKNVITVSPDTEIIQAAQLLIQKNINGAPVINKKGEIVGIICQSDLIAQQKNLPLPSLFRLLDGFIPLTSSKKLEKEVRKIAAITVADAMTEDPVTVTPDTSIGKIADLMVGKNYHSIPVVGDGGELVGIIGKEDILQTIL